MSFFMHSPGSQMSLWRSRPFFVQCLQLNSHTKHVVTELDVVWFFDRIYLIYEVLGSTKMYYSVSWILYNPEKRNKFVY